MRKQISNHTIDNHEVTIVQATSGKYSFKITSPTLRFCAYCRNNIWLRSEQTALAMAILIIKDQLKVGIGSEQFEVTLERNRYVAGIDPYTNDGGGSLHILKQ